VSRGRLERTTCEYGLRGRDRRRFNATTDSKHKLLVAPNRLDQNLQPTGSYLAASICEAINGATLCAFG
jgi:hypothetical protein